MSAPTSNADSNPEIIARLQLALEAGKEAGQLTLRHFQQGVDVERKADDSPVTLADRQAEQHLRRRIADAFADDAILGEEFGAQPGTSPVRWILDPIDGTKSFITGVPLYGTLIGIEVDGRAEFGFIYLPALAEGIYASRGGGAWHFRGDAEPAPARVSDAGSLAEGAFLTSEVHSFAQRGAAEAFTRLQDAAYITRTWGDCYGYLLVATGRALAMVDPIMNVWDAAALLPILQEAGGAFTDWQGRAAIDSGEGIGAAPGVLEEVLAVTRGYPQP